MRERFLGHFKETDETVSELWKTATFVFDANVLLNLYRYSDETRNDFLNLLQNLKSRSWLPEQAAHEFLKNRAAVIKDQIKSYEKTLGDIDNLRDSFSGSRAHPFISKIAKDKFDSAVEKIKDEMADNKKKQEELIHADSIKAQVADLFEGRVGEGYTNEKLAEMFAQGAERYAAKIPPGYKDGGKYPNPKTESDKRSNFGDWIIWKQVMDHATSAKTPIILVTDDRKEDWWEEEYGITLGPRPEITKEFMETCDRKILIYTPDNFLNASKIQLKTKISKNSIDEVEAEHSMRVKQSKNRRIERYNRQRAELERLDSNPAEFSERRRNVRPGRYSENSPQDELKRKKLGDLRRSGDIASPGLLTELSSDLETALSRKSYLLHRIHTIDMEIHNLAEADDREMVHEQLHLRRSIQEDLNDASDQVSLLETKLAYFKDRDDLF